MVDLHRALELPDQRGLIVGLLRRDQLLRRQVLVALEVELRSLELRDVPRQRALALVQLVDERPRIDLRQQIAGAHRLALAEEDLVEPAVDLRAYRHRLERDHAAEPVEEDGHVLLLHLRLDHRDLPIRRLLLLASRAGLLRFGAPVHEVRDCGDQDHGDGDQNDSAVLHLNYLRPRARRSCARAVASLSSACTSCADACVTATCASPSSIALPTPT